MITGLSKTEKSTSLNLRIWNAFLRPGFYEKIKDFYNLAKIKGNVNIDGRTKVTMEYDTLTLAKLVNEYHYDDFYHITNNILS
jgi:hypothetical protein